MLTGFVCLFVCLQNSEAKLGPPRVTSMRSYPECDTNSSTENANSSDSLDTPQQNRSAIDTARHYIFRFCCKQNVLLFNPRHLGGSASAPVIAKEEQFEDYGEGVDVDFTPSSPRPEEESRTNGFSDLGSSLPSRFVHLLKMQHKSLPQSSDYCYLPVDYFCLKLHLWAYSRMMGDDNRCDTYAVYSLHDTLIYELVKYK